VRALALSLAVVALASTEAEARPAADLVVVWAPGVELAPVADAARRAGAAVIDRSPAPRATPDTAGLVRRGIAAYDALQLADAARLLDEARALADRTGAAGLEPIELSDLFLYRALVKTQGGDPAAAWDELVTAVTVAPTRVLDPARFPPRVASDLERARSAVLDRATAMLTVTAPAGCDVRVDGVAAGTAPVARFVGPHWIDVACADRPRWGARIELTSDITLAAQNATLAPPSADELLIQARSAGAHAFLAVEVQRGIATARLVGVDGRERDRRTVSVGTTLAPLAPHVEELLSPRVASERPWYHSRWVWAAGAAALAAAVLVPVTAWATSDSGPTSARVGVDGVPSSW